MDPSEEETKPTTLSQSMENIEDVGLSSVEPDDGSSVDISSSVSCSFTEEEIALSTEASKAFSLSDYSGALPPMESLAKLRPEDVIVTHNLILTEFFGKKINLLQFQASLTSLLRDSPEYDPENQGIVLYNLALTNFFQRQFTQAEHHLLKLLEGNHSTHDDTFQKRVYSLLCRIYVCTRQGEKLQKCLNDLGSSSELTKHFFKVQSLLLSKNHKAFKKDFKDSHSFQDDKYNHTFEFLRSNMEYIKGNPRKAHKLLANLVIENGNSEVDSFYHNNVGIVHIMQDKPNLASHYLQEALEKTIKLFDEEENKKDISEGRTTPEYLLINKKIEITYNLAIALLNSGTYTELSFEYFIKTLPMFQKRPSLWLHMAECCIQSYQQLNSVPTYSDSVASIRDLKHKSTTLTSIGPIQYQKIVLTDSGGHPFTHPGVSVPVPLNPPKNNNLNLDFALSCLRNASVLIKMNRYKQESLFAATLVNHSYVCLLIKDYVTAFHKAQELLDFLVSASTHIKDGSTYKLLGHLYAGEALIYLDRISEATEHLGPLTLQSLDTEMSSGGDESDDCFKKNTPYGGLGFSALNFNLSVAFALRGELDKAKGVLDKSTGPKSVELATKITMMNLYIYIMKKDMKTCREIIQENCDVVKIPFTAQAK